MRLLIIVRCWMLADWPVWPDVWRHYNLPHSAHVTRCQTFDATEWLGGIACDIRLLDSLERHTQCYRVTDFPQRGEPETSRTLSGSTVFKLCAVILIHNETRITWMQIQLLCYTVEWSIDTYFDYMMTIFQARKHKSNKIPNRICGSQSFPDQ